MSGKVRFSAPTGAAAEAAAVAITHGSWAELLGDMEARLERGAGFSVATLNLDHIVKLGRDPKFAQAYLDHSHVVADGNPVVLLSRLAGRDVELIPGSELIGPVCEIAARLRVPVALFGSTEEALARAAGVLRDTHEGIDIAAAISPPFGFDPEGEASDRYLQEIRARGCRLCFLALGAPKQEVLASRWARGYPECGFVSIGAGLDFLAGTQTRAPKLFRRLALEWLWRLLSNPRRLGKRYLECALILPKLTVQAISSRQ